MRHSAMFVASAHRWATRFLPLLLCIGAFFLYFATLDRGFQPGELEGGDLITHQYAQVQARPSNAPGYPLYTMGGWLWFHGFRFLLQLMGNPFPNPIPILSSYSTLWALLCIWLLYLILCRLTRSEQRPDGDKTIAALLTVFYAVTYFFWYYATTTEQYTSAIAQTLAIVYLYLRWEAAIGNDPQSVGGQTLMTLAFLCGIALAHMLTVAFIVPPLIVVILWQRPVLLRLWSLILGCIVAASLPLISYLYVYVRGASHPEWWGAGNWQNATEWFWAFLSTAQGREELSWGLERGRAFFGGQFPALIWQELSLPFLLWGLIGIRFLGRYLATVFYGSLAIYLFFCWMYRYGNWFQVILPAYPLILLGIVGPLNELERRINTILPKGRRRLVILTLVIGILWRFDSSLIPANSAQRPGDTALDRAAILIDQPLPANAALFAAVNDTLALQYLIDIWQIRPDLHTVSSKEAGQALQAGQRLFSTWEALPTLLSELPGLSLYPVTFSSDWAELQTDEILSGKPEIQRLVGRVIDGEAVVLTGYNIALAPTGQPVAKSHTAADITLFWQLSNGVWPAGLSISVRPMIRRNYVTTAAGDNSIVQQDTSAPMRGILSSEAFLQDTIIADPYRLPLSVDELQSVDQIQVILYRSSNEGFTQVAEVLLPIQQPIHQ